MADPKQAKAAAPPADAAAKKPGGSKLVVILLAVNTLLTAGVLAYQFLRPSGGGKGGSEKAEKTDKAAAHAAEAKANAVGPTIRLADFTVHLRDTDADHYARVTFDLEPRGKVVKLTVTHDNLDEGGKTFRDISGGWPMVIANLKSLLETGHPLPAMAPSPAA